MKKTLVILFTILCVHKGFSQGYMDKIVDLSCHCLDQIPDTTEMQEFNMKLGLCMIDAAMPYKTQLKKDYDIDMNKIEVEGEKLGKLIGLKMASVCPNSLVKMTQRGKGKSEAVKKEQASHGTVTKIENDFFVTFSVKDESGKIMKYHWLTFINSDLDLVNNYNTLVGKAIDITYDALEFFDPKIGEYRQFMVIKKIALTH